MMEYVNRDNITPVTEDWQYRVLEDYFASRVMIGYLSPGSSLYDFHVRRIADTEQRIGTIFTLFPLDRK